MSALTAREVWGQPVEALKLAAQSADTYYTPAITAHSEKDCRMLPPRPDAMSSLLTLLVAASIVAMSRGAGFSTPVAALVGAATATVGWWAYTSEP